MRKWIIAIIAAVMALPVFGSAVFAEEDVVYQDGEYDVPFVLYKEGTDEVSASDSSLVSPAKLTVENGVNYFEVQVNNVDMVQSVNMPGQAEDLISEDGDSKVVGLTINENLNHRVKMETQVVVPGLYDTVHTVDADFDMSGVPVVEEETEEPVEDVEADSEEEQAEDEAADSEEEPAEEEAANEVFTYMYQTEEVDLSRNFENPVTVIQKDGTNYVQMQGSGAQFIDSLTINGEEVTIGEVNEDNTYTLQFELPSLTDTVTFSMYLTTPIGEMDHHAQLSLNLDSKEVAENQDYTIYTKSVPLPTVPAPAPEEPEEPEAPEVETDITVSLGEEVSVHGIDSITIEETGDSLTLPSDLPEGVTLTISEQTPRNVGDLEVAGAVYEFDFTGLGNYDGEFTLALNYDSDEFSSEQVDIYYYDEASQEWIAQSGNASNGVITLVTDHFSTYGVFAAPAEEEATDPTAVDRAFTINYTILDAAGNEVSAADGFFEKPATLLEKDGVQYIQIVTNANQFIDSLSNQYGDFLYVGEDADGNHIYQFRVVGDLADAQEIDMVITVPGVYDGQEYGTNLILDPNSLEEVDASAYQLVTSNENANGPSEDGTQPEVENANGNENDNENGNGGLDPRTPSRPGIEEPENNGSSTSGNDTNGESLNPKTGEETNIMLYVLLMVASLIPLVIKAKRHFA